jgi:hypothetical protein
VGALFNVRSYFVTVGGGGVVGVAAAREIEKVTYLFQPEDRSAASNSADAL